MKIQELERNFGGRTTYIDYFKKGGIALSPIPNKDLQFHSPRENKNPLQQINQLNQLQHINNLIKDDISKSKINTTFNSARNNVNTHFTFSPPLFKNNKIKKRIYKNVIDKDIELNKEDDKENNNEKELLTEADRILKINETNETIHSHRFEVYYYNFFTYKSNKNKGNSV